MAAPDPDDQLRLLCRALNEAGVAYLLFGSHAARLHGAIGNIDIVLRPRGFEAGYPALSPGSVTMSVGGVEVHVGGLDDLILSKRLLRRPKDLDQLPALEDLRDHLQSAIAELPDRGSSLVPDEPAAY